MKRFLLFLCTVTLVFGVVGTASAVPLTSGEWGEHQYAVVAWTGTWESANSDVTTELGPSWYLAAITSQAEQDFIASLLTSLFGDNGPSLIWAGGYQDTSNIDPDLEDSDKAQANWNWVTGETWDYTNWGDGTYPEPNDWGTEAYSGEESYLALDFRETPERTGQWNDAPDGGHQQVVAYVAEAPVPEPATLLLLGAGLLGLAGFGRKRFFRKGR